MDRKQAEARITELRELLEYHSNRYYNMDSPEISDYEYDTMMRELKSLEKDFPDSVTPDSPTQKVGGTAKREAGVLVRHNVPMLSLQDVFSREEVEEFVEEMQKQLENPEFVVEYKIDGLSMALRYEEGILKTAVTRGDGVTFGEDVTANAKVIPDVKKRLKVPVEYLEVRGEVYMKNKDFARVNENQELKGKKPFANPRNCAAGTLRQLDSKITKERGLSMFVFNIQQVQGMEILTHTQGYEYLKQNGIPVIDGYRACKTKEEVWDAICAIGENRGNLGYDIDGAVVKINSLKDREKLGRTHIVSGLRRHAKSSRVLQKLFPGIGRAVYKRLVGNRLLFGCLHNRLHGFLRNPVTFQTISGGHMIHCRTVQGNCIFHAGQLHHIAGQRIECPPAGNNYMNARCDDLFQSPSVVFRQTPFFI